VSRPLPLPGLRCRQQAGQLLELENRQLDFPGRTATVNGAPTRVVLVDGVFQGVVVPRGHSAVVFSYEPPGLELGEVISLVGILWIGIVTLIGVEEA
jgi:hypothetical protein